MDFAEYSPEHFKWRCQDGVAQITLCRPAKKNPLTFDSYAELRDCFRALAHTDEIGPSSLPEKAETSAPAAM